VRSMPVVQISHLPAKGHSFYDGREVNRHVGAIGRSRASPDVKGSRPALTSVHPSCIQESKQRK
jgi:hypothetical protein